jgi:hypothetical protein
MKFKLFLFVVLITLSACKNKTDTIEDILKKWSGKTVYFPDLNPVYVNKTNMRHENKNSYKILNYVDSELLTWRRLDCRDF